MDLFYVIVAGTAIVVLVCALTFFGLYMQKAKRSDTFPPNASICPDLWFTEANRCTYNGRNSGTYDLSNNTINYDRIDGKDPLKAKSSKSTDPNSKTVIAFDPTDSIWGSGNAALCTKKAWANQHNILWSGISEYNDCSN